MVKYTKKQFNQHLVDMRPYTVITDQIRDQMISSPDQVRNYRVLELDMSFTATKIENDILLKRLFGPELGKVGSYIKSLRYIKYRGWTIALHNGAYLGRYIRILIYIPKEEKASITRSDLLDKYSYLGEEIIEILKSGL